MNQNNAITIDAIGDLIVPIDGYSAMKRGMLTGQLERYWRSASWIEPRRGGSLLDLGACGDLVPAYCELLGYERVVCADAAGESRATELVHANGRRFAFESVGVDLEHQPLPFADDSFDQVVAMEIIEHLAVDPMFMLAEANRVLKPGGNLLITTPNIASLTSLYLQLWGRHPAIGRQAFGPGIMDRHHREYAPEELRTIVQAAGFGVDQFDTFDIDPQNRSVRRVGRLLRVLSWLKPAIGDVQRGSTMRCTATKVGPVAERFPPLIYPRYPYYDYAAFDRRLTERFGGNRYWHSDVIDEKSCKSGIHAGAASAISSTPVPQPIND